jgi:hypothetical protein
MRWSCSATYPDGGSPADGRSAFGWAGKPNREHVDLDVAPLRTNQRIFWRRLDGWDLHLGTALDVVEPYHCWNRASPTNRRRLAARSNGLCATSQT